MEINLYLYSNYCAVPQLSPLFITLPASSSPCEQHLPCFIAVNLLSLNKQNSHASELAQLLCTKQTFLYFFRLAQGKFSGMI